MMSVAQINHNSLLPSDISTGYCFSGSSDSGSECFSSELEEDDCIAELTRQMAQYTFRDEEIHEKTWGSPISPQSTLWSPLEWNQASLTGKSPPATPESEKMKINEEIPKFASPTPIQSAKENPEAGFSKKSIIDEQIRAIQFNKLKQEQSMKLMNEKRRINQSWSNNGLRIPFQPCPPQQGRRNYGSDRFKAVFLNKPDSKAGSTGTGVFLPQDVGTLSQTPKKKGCSAVLIPTRVVQALKLHLEKTGVPSRFDIDSGFPLQKESHVIPSKKESSGQKRYPRTVPAVNHQDLGLPQEWTY